MQGPCKGPGNFIQDIEARSFDIPFAARAGDLLHGLSVSSSHEEQGPLPHHVFQLLPPVLLSQRALLDGDFPADADSFEQWQSPRHRGSSCYRCGYVHVHWPSGPRCARIWGRWRLYQRRHTMFALQSNMFFATDIDAPTMPLDLVHDLAAVSVCYTRHASMIQRGVSILRETATRTAFSRPLDPFMLASVVDQLGGPAAACLNEIIKYFNSHFFAQPRLQLSADTAKRIKLLLNPECGT